MRVFLSTRWLEERGEAQYKMAIDTALEAAQVLIAVGTSVANLESRWVRYEWDSFFNDILCGRKRRRNPTSRCAREYDVNRIAS